MERKRKKTREKKMREKKKDKKKRQERQTVMIMIMMMTRLRMTPRAKITRRKKRTMHPLSKILVSKKILMEMSDRMMTTMIVLTRTGWGPSITNYL